MSKSNSILSYPHCKEIWDSAYAHHSIMVEVKDKREQATLIGDLFHYRLLVRKDNDRYYPEGHPEHRTSIFDPFHVSKVTTPNGLGIRIRRRDVRQYKINIEEIDSYE